MFGVSGGIGALLENHRGACRITNFIPADAGPAGTRVHRVVGHQGLMVAEITILQAIHQAVAERIQLLGGSGLGDAGEGARRTGE